MRIPSSTVCYAFLPLTRKFLHQLQAHQLCFTDPDRAVSPGEQGTMAEGNRSWAGPEPGAPAQLSPTAGWQGIHPQAGNTQGWLFFQSQPLELAAQPLQQGLCRTSVRGRTKTLYNPHWRFRRKKPQFLNFLRLLPSWKGHTG